MKFIVVCWLVWVVTVPLGFTNFFFSILFSDLVNVFEVFLPQLLLYPNPSDPLNGEAAALMMRDRTAYDQKVKGSKHFCLLGISNNLPLFLVNLCELKKRVFANHRPTKLLWFLWHFEIWMVHLFLKKTQILFDVVYVICQLCKLTPLVSPLNEIVLQTNNALPHV